MSVIVLSSFLCVIGNQEQSVCLHQHKLLLSFLNSGAFMLLFLAELAVASTLSLWLLPPHFATRHSCTDHLQLPMSPDKIPTLSKHA